MNKRTWEPQGNFNDLRKGQQRVEKVKGQVGNPTAPGSHLIASQQITGQLKWEFSAQRVHWLKEGRMC